MTDKERRLSNIDKKYHCLFADDDYVEVWWPRGWDKVVYDTLYELLSLHEETGDLPEITTIKEKFGELRIYPKSFHNSNVLSLCSAATSLSRQVCQRCGLDDTSVQIRPVPESSAIIASLCRSCGKGPEIENTGSSGL